MSDKLNNTNIPRSKGNDYDVIVIGSGAGGAPVAMSLCEKKLKVAMVEKGPLLKVDTPPRFLEKHYVGQGLTASLNGGILLTLAGSTVGGTTSINSGTCLNPLPECLSNWEKITGLNFTEGILDTHLKRAAEQIGVCIPPKTLLSKSAAIFDNGLKAIGRNGAYILPRNAPACKGSGRCCFFCTSLEKKSTDIAYLPEAIEKGLDLYANTKVTAIVEKPNGVFITIDDGDRKSTRLNSSHTDISRMPSSA